MLCFGDSNTYGYDPRSFFGSQYPSQYRWVDILAGKLGCEIVNAGENGREIPRREGELLRFDMMLTHEMPVDFLFVMLGGNDLLQGISVSEAVKRMEVFLEHVALEKAKIHLIGPPPMRRGEWVSAQSLIDASKELNREYKALAKRIGVCFVDAGAWEIPMTFDGVHFTEEGHKTFAEGLFRYLNKGG